MLGGIARLALGLGLVAALAPASSGALPVPTDPTLIQLPLGSPVLDMLVDAPIQLDGAKKEGHVGASLATGDVNGDGHADLVGGTDEDAAYVLFGPFPSLLDLRALGTTAPGFGVVGKGLDREVDVAGDVNGDGLDDVLLTSADRSTAAVVFGRTSTSTVDLQALGSDGYTIDLGPPATSTLISERAAAAGDVNGDGLDDLLLTPSTETDTAYVVFGKATTDGQDISHLGSGGYAIEFGNGDTLGALAAAGDVNGDGLDDVLVGDSEFPRAVWVVYGKANTTPEKADALGPSAGYGITGSSIGYARTAVSAGDANGDGVPDQLLVSSTGSTAAVVFGQRGATETIDLEALGSHGYLIEPLNGADPFFPDVSLAGGVDLNGDGRADQALGYMSDNFPEAGRVDSGTVYVVYGKATTTSVTAGRGGTGYRLGGPAATALGTGLALTPAGLDEPQVIAGAPGNDANGRTDSGTVYVVPSSQAPKAKGIAVDVQLVVEPPSSRIRSTSRTLRLTLARPTDVVARVERLVPGHRVGTRAPRCQAGRAAKPADRCTIARAVATWKRRLGTRGRHAVKLDRDLAPGRYRLVVSLTDAAGHRPEPYRVEFTVRASG